MVCIYCGSSRLSVINSRAQKRLNQVWRRRQCQACHAIFTSTEAVDYSKSLAVQNSKNEIRPFIREKLLVSVLKCCQHRKAALGDAMGLSDTIISKLLANNSHPIQTQAIIRTITDTLEHFDHAAAVQYAAYHRT